MGAIALRTQRHAYRPRWHLVPRGAADRPVSNGKAVFDRAASRAGRHACARDPVEKLEIDVETTAFRAVAMSTEGEGRGRTIAFKLDSGDAVIAGRDHPLTFAAANHGPSPRLAVRHGLEAELSRPIYYELAEIALAEGQEPAGVWSNGAFFPLEAEQE
jgi:hypothetical protein